MTDSGSRRILMVAAENGALPGAKVGGIADVIRGLPPALAGLGWQPTVITPGYDSLSRLPGAELLGRINVPFAGKMEIVTLHRVPGPDPRVEHRVLEHPRMSPDGPGRIYHHDPAHRPFATDAGKFAFFSAAVASALVQGKLQADVVHLHDWHAALYLALRAWAPEYRSLAGLRTVYTIHNLALQGIRPLRDDPSSLQAWFPRLAWDPEVLTDPRYPDCVNPMRVGIRLSDGLNTVSPTYAREILQPNDPVRGFHGGEGLEADLRQADADGRLVGILNGCEYPAQGPGGKPDWGQFVDGLRDGLKAWAGRGKLPETLREVAQRRLARIAGQRPRLLLTSVGRLTAQKVELFMQDAGNGVSALETLLDELGDQALVVILGSGDAEYERRFFDLALRRNNLFFLCGYSERMAAALFQAGDLFLMPSSFEPCGISQLLAMAQGQPCVVHGVGGLRDTVVEGETGFVFDGESVGEQAAGFVAAVRRGTGLALSDPDAWQQLCRRAAAVRCTWELAAERYQEALYAHGRG